MYVKFKIPTEVIYHYLRFYVHFAMHPIKIEKQFFNAECFIFFFYGVSCSAAWPLTAAVSLISSRLLKYLLIIIIILLFAA